jgi:hypothetical protein
MKLEQLASLLKKDAADLEGSLSLQKTDEVPFEQISREIEAALKQQHISGLSEGKKQGEGKAKREILTDLESKIKGKFDVSGNLDEMIEALSEKVSKPIPGADEKIIKERDAWKAKFDEVQNQLTQKVKEFERVELVSTVKGKLKPILEKYSFVTPKVEQVALENYINGNEFIISGDDVFIVQDGKPVVAFETTAEKHFAEFGTPKDQRKTFPGAATQKPGGTSYGTTQKELFTALRAAKTPEEAATIQQQIASLDSQTN